jgi:hypothetical protein
LRLLLVEDNRHLAAMTVQGLEQAGYVVDHQACLADARDVLAVTTYDLLILDLGLPDGDGLSLLRDLRQARLSTPVILLTARGGLDDRIDGLDAGADDYLIKPFEVAELAARCRALLRRPGSSLDTIMTVGDLRLDITARSARTEASPLDLTPKEFALLELLARRPDGMATREQLEHSLYSLEAEVSPNALDALVSRLRRKLQSAGAHMGVRAVHGVGYALSAQTPPLPAPPASTSGRAS